MTKLDTCTYDITEGLVIDRETTLPTEVGSQTIMAESLNGHQFRLHACELAEVTENSAVLEDKQGTRKNHSYRQAQTRQVSEPHEYDGNRNAHSHQRGRRASCDPRPPPANQQGAEESTQEDLPDYRPS